VSRPTEIDLTSTLQAWRTVPMPGANDGIELVPLASAPDRFTILGRFPAGFERLTPGGYRCSEEFLVLDGELEFEGTTCTRGDLTVVPTHLVRTAMRTTAGCLVLAWFGGPAIFRRPDELDEPDGEIVSVRAIERSSTLPRSAVGSWARGPVTDEDVFEVIDDELRSWRRGAGAAPAGTLVRHDLPAEPGKTG
jgi:hypothetical protein